MRLTRALAGFLLAALSAGAPGGMPANGTPAPRPAAIAGRVTYRTGPERVEKPEAKAKVWLFRGRQDLALGSVEKLRKFEAGFPNGLTRVEDRPKEDAARMAAMVLMSYAVVHEGELLRSVPVTPGGAFQLTWNGKELLTVVVESEATIGSYHMPRYAAAALAPGHPAPSLRIDFGVSHLENHPAPMAGQ